MNLFQDGYSEWYEIVKPILEHPEFQRRKTYKHHGEITVYEHTMKVSMLLYKMAKKRGLDVRSASIAGLLHDFYEHPWMDDKEWKPFFKRHGFTHGQNALDNSRKYFSEYLNPVIEDSIKRHMFPLTITPPIYRIGWLLTLADKRVSLECFSQTKFFVDMYFGIRGKRK